MLAAPVVVSRDVGLRVARGHLVKAVKRANTFARGKVFNVEFAVTQHIDALGQTLAQARHRTVLVEGETVSHSMSDSMVQRSRSGPIETVG